MQAVQQKTTLANKDKLEPVWFVTSADGEILGRLANRIAVVLMGKHKSDYTPHVDTGDFVIVTDAQKVVLTGKKVQTKTYDYYTYYAGGHKYVSFEDMLARKPETVISEAVRRMLPKTKLGKQMLRKLKVYRGSEHPHAAQCPQPLDTVIYTHRI